MRPDIKEVAAGLIDGTPKLFAVSVFSEISGDEHWGGLGIAHQIAHLYI
jgi:hypothetical protein